MTELKDRIISKINDIIKDKKLMKELAENTGIKLNLNTNINIAEYAENKLENILELK